MAEPNQTQHALNIKAERHLMQSLGTTREQARNVLHAGRTALQARDNEQRKEIFTGKPTTPQPLQIQTEVQEFRPKPLTLEVQQRGGGGQGIGGGGPTITGTVRLFANGDLIERDVYLTEGF